MADLAMLTRLCQQVTAGQVPPDRARTLAVTECGVDPDRANTQARWARANFDPKRQLVDPTWAPFAQLEASIMALETHTQTQARYRKARR